jgi:hypothetical protein
MEQRSGFFVPLLRLLPTGSLFDQKYFSLKPTFSTIVEKLLYNEKFTKSIPNFLGASFLKSSRSAPPGNKLPHPISSKTGPDA